jgi:probable HAF family extracellular repeat protein
MNAKLIGIAALLLCVGVSGASNATTYTFADVDIPGAVGTLPAGINDAGQIVGIYNIDLGGLNSSGFLSSGGNYTTLHDPATSGPTAALGINNSG